MYIEHRKNGTFYLKDSIYNSKTKQPQNTSIYLGSNALQAKEKLKTLTEDPVLLAQIPDTALFEIELIKALKSLEKLKKVKSPALARLLNEYVNDLLAAQQFIESAKKGVIMPAANCSGCLFKQVNHCKYFGHDFTYGAKKYRDIQPAQCLAAEPGQNPSHTGSIKLPRDFRTL